MKRFAAAVALAVAAGFAVLGTGGVAGAAENASVSVVHGIPNTPVNVFVNDKLTLREFKPGTVAGPLSLPAGSYRVEVFPAANTAGTGSPVISATAQVPAGANVTLAAHLTAAGKPTITPFVNDVSKLAAGQARLVVRHTAAAPAVDVRAGGTPVIKGLTNPRQQALTLPAATVKADVVLAGTGTVVLGPADVTLKEGTATIVYAIGSAEQDTLGLVVQTISGLHSAPSGVPAGSGGLADSGVPGWLALTVVGGLLLAAGGGARVAASRR
ncbi:MAG TPA: DUF4397 domain-containing protein [Mycobacteriales bacterium]|jgi:hypothetical protein|nr:DUF4397 domain-containing protein [Mycobacteriales bacterium]